MLKIIDGRAIAKKEKDKIVKEIVRLKRARPNLAIILVGSRPDSKLYVSLKEKEGKNVGIDTHLYELDENISEEELLEVIDFLNKDESIDGILIQLPLPKKFNTNKIIEAIDPKKDVDGFHPLHPEYIVSPVLAAVKACLDYVKIDKKDKRACIFYRSPVFGDSLKSLLEKEGFQILPSSKSEQVDLVITALGEPGKIKKEMLKKDAVIIDIGITKEGKKVSGDVDIENLKEHIAYLTPVPGGIGPMTIAFLFKNVLEIFKRRS
jgi:methylenetetrahydrofolate dehydrogenase (NADP+) / methenyltetrahydrofolate cyclohydrolase